MGSRVPKRKAHGTHNCYQAGCRCVKCRRAWATYMREYNARMRVERPDAWATLRAKAAATTKAWAAKYPEQAKAGQARVNKRLRKTKKYKAAKRAYRKRCRCDPVRRIEGTLRNRLKDLVEPLSRKATKMHSLIGCTRPYLRSHLEAQFLPGQTWLNYGTAWHVDHIMPVASYNLEVPEQQRACFHYTNLQPLWDEINMAKSDSITFDTSYAIAMTPYPS